MGGRLGAPVPQHVGLPTIHLKNLTCTTCHSGPYPQAAAVRVQTSRGHALEYQGDFRGDDALPFIENPVYARRPDGQIGPQRMVWPAFWARVDGEQGRRRCRPMWSTRSARPSSTRRMRARLRRG